MAPGYRGSKQKVMEQEMKDGKLVRTLACGHLQAIRPGGKSKLATLAYCKVCKGEMPLQRYDFCPEFLPRPPEPVD